ncbi:hypothetical protein SVIOM74S_03025 [Streptomyces violarus]
MPCRAGHMPFSRNQPAAVTAWSATSGTSTAYVPTAAAPASSRPSSAVSRAGCIPGSMIGDRPSARARCASVMRGFPARVAGPSGAVGGGGGGCGRRGVGLGLRLRLGLRLGLGLGPGRRGPAGCWYCACSYPGLPVRLLRVRLRLPLVLLLRVRGLLVLLRRQVRSSPPGGRRDRRLHGRLPGLPLPLLGVLLVGVRIVVPLAGPGGRRWRRLLPLPVRVGGPVVGGPVPRVSVVPLVRLVRHRSPSCERREHLDRAAVGQPYRLMRAGAHRTTVDEERAPQQDAREFPGVSPAHRVERSGEGLRLVRLSATPAAAFAAAQYRTVTFADPPVPQSDDGEQPPG